MNLKWTKRILLTKANVDTIADEVCWCVSLDLLRYNRRRVIPFIMLDKQKTYDQETF